MFKHFQHTKDVALAFARAAFLVDTKFHYMRECIEDGRFEVDHVGTDGQLADILTNALGRVMFVEMRQKLGVEA